MKSSLTDSYLPALSDLNGSVGLTISREARRWYDSHKRDLPWRHTKDPYLIWISEVILQQTRVAQGMDYYLRFIGRFPDVSSLAAAPEEEVLRLWQGLGYYSRARNLRQAAQMIMNDFGGCFPHDYAKVLLLKGVGSYTAAAIVSFAFGGSYPVLDGNVMRVLSRLFAVDVPIDTQEGKKLFLSLAERLLDPMHPAEHNQAMMEIGALQCVPADPDCPACPFSAICSACASRRVGDYPMKSHVTKVRDRYPVYYYIIYKGSVWLHHREDRDIWRGLYDFPSVEFDHEPDDAETIRSLKSLLPEDTETVIHGNPVRLLHKLTHQTLHATFLNVELVEDVDMPDYLKTVNLTELDRYPMPRLMLNYLIHESL